MTHDAPRARFDPVAEGFAARAGLPVEACVAAAEVVSRWVDDASETLLDVGAGTGDVGLELARRCPSYLGVDLSREMLERFRGRAGTLSPRLVVADASARFPVDDGSCRVIFGSRSLHLLDAGHVLAEARRAVVTRGGYLVIGSVERDRDALRSRMRRRMRAALDEAGVVGRSSHKGRLRRALVDAGLELERHEVAAWTSESCAEDSLRAWSRLDGLDNVDLPADVKSRVLDTVRARTLAEEGALDRRETSGERYVLDVALLRPDASR